MVVIKELGYTICVAMVLMVYLKQLMPSSKNAVIVKAIISVFILFSVIASVRQLDWKSNVPMPTRNSRDDIIERVESGLMEEYNRFLKEQQINANVYDLVLDDQYRVISLQITGEERSMGRDLLSARYQIDQAKIEVKDE